MFFACLYDGDHLVDIVEGHLQTFEDVEPVGRLVQLEGGPPGHHLLPEIDELADHLLQVEVLRLVVDDGEEDDAEGGLELGLLVELVEDGQRDLVPLQLDDDPDALPVRFVPYVRYALYLLVVYQLDDVLDEPRLVDLVGELGDDDRFPAVLLALLDVRRRPQQYVASSRLVGVPDAFPAVDERLGGEIGAGDVRHQLVDGNGRVVDVGDGAVDHLGHVVGRNIRRHADRDAGGAVYQQVRDPGGEDDRLFQRLVVVELERDRVLLYVLEDLLGDPGKPDLRVPHGGRRIAVYGAEVALSVDEGISQGELLDHPRNRVVDGLIAVGMVLADHVADDPGRFLVRLVVHVVQLVHGEEYSPVHRFQTVPDIGQGPADNGAHGIVQIGPPHLVFNRYDRGCRHRFSLLADTAAHRPKTRIAAARRPKGSACTTTRMGLVEKRVKPGNTLP